jgi:hypothetical protein
MKVAWRVREGAAREKGQKWHLARQPTSTQETGDRAQVSGAAYREIRVIWRNCAAKRPVVSPIEPGRTRRIVLEPDG